MVIVITGASSGFGKEAACAFAERGASVVLAARHAELLAELAEECIALGGRALPVTTDVGRREDVERLAQTSLREFGRIDVWINNAGNLLGTLYGAWYAYRHFLEQRAGTLINLSSEHGVAGLGDSLRREIDQAGLKDRIRVCTVLPAAVETLVRLAYDPKDRASAGTEVRADR